MNQIIDSVEERALPLACSLLSMLFFPSFPALPTQSLREACRAFTAAIWAKKEAVNLVASSEFSEGEGTSQKWSRLWAASIASHHFW